VASCSSALVELLTHDPKFEGSNPASAGTGREEMARKVKSFYFCFQASFLNKKLNIRGKRINLVSTL
jgi:hypothetical protein